MKNLSWVAVGVALFWGAVCWGERPTGCELLMSHHAIVEQAQSLQQAFVEKGENHVGLILPSIREAARRIEYGLLFGPQMAEDGFKIRPMRTRAIVQPPQDFRLFSQNYSARIRSAIQRGVIHDEDVLWPGIGVQGHQLLAAGLEDLPAEDFTISDQDVEEAVFFREMNRGVYPFAIDPRQFSVHDYFHFYIFSTSDAGLRYMAALKRLAGRIHRGEMTVRGYSPKIAALLEFLELPNIENHSTLQTIIKYAEPGAQLSFSQHEQMLIQGMKDAPIEFGQMLAEVLMLAPNAITRAGAALCDGYNVLRIHEDFLIRNINIGVEPLIDGQYYNSLDVLLVKAYFAGKALGYPIATLTPADYLYGVAQKYQHNGRFLRNLAAAAQDKSGHITLSLAHTVTRILRQFYFAQEYQITAEKFVDQIGQNDIDLDSDSAQYLRASEFSQSWARRTFEVYF